MLSRASLPCTLLLVLSLSTPLRAQPEPPATSSPAPAPATSSPAPAPATSSPAPAPAAPAPAVPGPDTSTEAADPALEKVEATGLVLDIERKPVIGAKVRVKDRRIEATTNVNGRYQLPPLKPGIYFLDITAPGFAQGSFAVRVTALEPIAPVTLRRTRKGPAKAGADLGESELIEVTETIIEAPQPVERVLTLQEIKRAPGSFNDAVRAVQNLPGVARSPVGLLIVRGTEPQDTGYYIDGIRIPQIFHFFGLHTVINTDMLEQVSFLPGNYGVRYGRTYGGVVEAATTELIPEKFNASLGVDLLNSFAFAKVPLRENMGLLLSVRRSYADLVLEKGIEVYEQIRDDDVNLGIIQAPRYWDYQALYNWRPNSRNFIHVLAFGSSDVVRLVTDPPASVNPMLRAGGQAGSTFAFHKALARWRYTGDGFTSQLTVATGPDLQEFSFGGFYATGSNLGIFAREDLSFKLKVLPITLRTGVDLLVGKYGFEVELPFSIDTVSLDPLGELEPSSISGDGWFWSPSFYLEAEYDLTKQLKIVPGVRVDPFSVPGTYTTAWVDPRLAVSWRAARATLLKGSVGRFGQNPQPFAIDPEFGGASDLDPPYALQYSAGIEQGVGSFITLEATGFYSDLRKLVIIPQSQGGNEERPDFTNDGRGRNIGLEVLLRHAPYKGFFGWVSYTLASAQRLDGLEPAPKDQCENPTQGFLGPCWYPFDFDQTHILTVVGSYELPKGWTVGGRFRFSTGVPYTRIVDAYYDVDTNRYQPLPAFSGIRNESRIPPFHDLTVRVDKNFKIKQVKLNAYLEVINAYNRANPEAVDYSFDYDEEVFINGLPIFPNLGLRADF